MQLYWISPSTQWKCHFLWFLDMCNICNWVNIARFHDNFCVSLEISQWKRAKRNMLCSSNKLKIIIYYHRNLTISWTRFMHIVVTFALNWRIFLSFFSLNRWLFRKANEQWDTKYSIKRIFIQVPNNILVLDAFFCVLNDVFKDVWQIFAFQEIFTHFYLLFAFIYYGTWSSILYYDVNTCAFYL